MDLCKSMTPEQHTYNASGEEKGRHQDQRGELNGPTGGEN